MTQRTVRQLITELEALAATYGDETGVYLDSADIIAPLGEPIHMRFGGNRIFLQAQYYQEQQMGKKPCPSG